MSLRTRLTLAFAYVLFLALVAFGIPLGVNLSDRVEAEVRSQARSQADVVAASASELIAHGTRDTLHRLVDLSARAQRGRVLVVGIGGKVLADSTGPAELGASYGSRPEIATALTGRSNQESRRSSTLDQRILATAAPIRDEGHIVGAIRITQSVQAVDDAVGKAIGSLLALGAVVLALGVTAAVLIARETSRPILELERAARAVEGGDLDATAPIEGSTEQRALAASFNRMTARLAKMIGNQQDFVADASHQLRTPLSGIRLLLEEIHEEEAEGAERRAEVHSALGELDRLSKIVDELLILSRAGEHELPGYPLELGDAADDATERWTRPAGEKGIVLTQHRDGTAGTTLCTRTDLDRVLDSLIENAVRYSPPGSEIAIAGSPQRIEILDQGPGLDPGETEKVFERFYRGSAARGGTEGTGLGLPIARELAGQWGGTVTIGGREGGGARASLEMPAVSTQNPVVVAAATGGSR